MSTKAMQKFPDFLPNIRIAGPIGRPHPLSNGKTHCTVDLPPKIVSEMKSKVTLELRVLILIDVPPTQKDKPQPGSITVGSTSSSKTLANPRWTKLSNYWVHETPVDLGFLIVSPSRTKALKVEFDLIVDILDQACATGVADVFLSRHVSTATLIRSVLGADPLPDMVEERRLNMKDAGIQSEVVSLKCPCLGTRINTPVRFESCKHLECFDLHNFLKMEEKRPKGRCPVCNKLIEFKTLGVCDFTAKILANNENCESYRITPEGVEPLSPETASETRKRRRGLLTSSANVTQAVKPQQPMPTADQNVEAPPKRRRVQAEKQTGKIKTYEVPVPQQTLTESPEYIVID